MALLSHVMLFIASLLTTPMGIGHAQVSTATCDSRPLLAHEPHEAQRAHEAQVDHQSAWLPGSSEVSVRAYGPVRTRDVPSVRVLGRCVVKNAPADAHPVLYVPFGSQLDNSDDQDLAAARLETNVVFGQPAALRLGPADLHALLATVTQLERPPRV